MARQETIGDFLRFLIDHAPHMVNNVQVTQLANSGEFRRPCDKPDLRRASKIVREMAIPGVVEMFDESLAAAEYFLKPVFPELSLEYAPGNMSGSVESRALLTEDALREMWGNDLFEELWYINHLDLDLFRFATEEVARRNSLVPRFSRKLEEFRSRCARLRSLEEAPLAELAADRPMVVTR